MTERLMVVVVEDNDSLRQAIVEMLEREGFRAVGLPCAEDVDDTLFPFPPDLFVVDLNLPGEDGLSLAARLRRAQPRVGIVITTARTLLDDRLKGYESGADIYLPKPVDPQELILALRALGNRLLGAAPIEHVLTLDRRRCLLDGPSGSRRVSESEARLLMAFASAREQTLERWQVAVQLSPRGDRLSPESMQVRLSQLRAKIRACGYEGEVLKAIRNNGYRFGPQLRVD